MSQASNTAQDLAVSSETKGAVSVISVDDGKANAFSVSMLDALTAELSAAEADDAISAVVIAGNDRAFFAGFDLAVIQGGDPAAMAELVSAGGEFVRSVYGSSVPVVAASTGHAVAAGALLLLACDQRVGVDNPAKPVKIGLNEVAIALVLPGWALEIAAERLSRRHLQRCVANAHLLDGKGAIDAGFLDEVVPGGDGGAAVLDRAIEIAAGLAETLDGKAYAGTVKRLRSDVLARMDASITAERAAAA